MISEIKKSAKEYPGSYTLGASGRTKLNGVWVSFIAYTNPNNVTGMCYIHYTANGKERSIKKTNLDLFNVTEIKELITCDL